MLEKYIAQLNPHEMALRIAEACMSIERPKGQTAEDSLNTMKEQDPEAVRAFYRAAFAAAKYLEEEINNSQRVQ